MIFATCERHTAMRWLAHLYPSYKIEDSPDCAGPLLDLVAADVLRVSDPMMGTRAAVLPGNKWDSRYQKATEKALDGFTASLAGRKRAEEKAKPE